jgi:FlaG/FlaF family flagellin (archaellin)
MGREYTGTGERGATAPMGTILMAALVIVASGAAVVFYTDLADSLQEPAPQSRMSVDVVDDEVRFTHAGGDRLDTDDLNLVVDSGDERTRVPFADGRLDGTDDGNFTAGDRWRYCQQSTPGDSVTLELVHEPSNSILASVDRSAEATSHQGLEYQCASSQFQYNGQPGWVGFNLTNYGPGDVTITEMTVRTDSAAQISPSAGVTEIYVDSDGDYDYFEPGEGYVGLSSPVSVGPSPTTIDFSSTGSYRSEATIPAGNTAFVSLFRFTDGGGTAVDMRGATVAVTVTFSDGSSRTYSIVIPTEEYE